MTKASDFARLIQDTQKFIIQENHPGFRSLGILSFEFYKPLFEIHFIPGEIKNFTGFHASQVSKMQYQEGMPRKLIEQATPFFR